VLRERFTGQAEHVVNFFEFVAEEVREYLAELGFRTLDEAIGQVGALDVAEAVNHWKAAGLDLTPILHEPDRDGVPGQDLHQTSCRTTAWRSRSTHRAGAAVPAGDRARRAGARAGRGSATSTAPSAPSSATR
jgi:hypothetical protein